MFKKNILFVLFLIPALLFAERMKVACVGNSVTYGYKIDNRAFTYPAQLQQLLGDAYRVENFGHSGTTLLQKGHNPYRKLPVFEQALAFEPDIVVIHLGLNDTDPRNWPKFRDDFTRDYIDLIRSFQEKNPATKVWICRMTPIFSWHPRFKSSTRVWYEQVQQEIERVAAVTRVPLIDLNRPLYNRPDLFPDALHPTAEGAGIIAKTVYNAITGDYGGLQLPDIFTDNMVMQRNRPVKFWGTADAATKVTVHFAGKTSTSQSGHNGKWTVEFPPMEAGGPYNSTIENQERSIRLTDILVGEVWICSGQSNMAFRLQDAATAREDIPRAVNRQLRFFDMKEIAPTTAVEWNDSVLAAVNRLNYYRHTAWTYSDSITAKQFSAVAYHFGRMLQEELDVPVGLIQNAIGGSPTEAWIDRKTMERNPLLVDFFINWSSNDFIDGWVRERGMLNIARAKENPFQQHPYKPSYLFETAMAPISGYPIAGAIWYQGESNSYNVELHEQMLPLLVKSWRNAWDECFPFYYVQLSSMETGRESWGHFRDSQRRLMERIPHSGMAVSSDLGNRTDVHPRRKKEVGERLARWALADSYGKNIRKSGPLFKEVHFEKEIAVVTFGETKRLRTSNNNAVRNIELAGEDKIFHPAKAVIRDNRLEVTCDKVPRPAFVRYGWNSYTDGNLVNEAGLPASTFSSEYP
ncbi:MAG: hypothetical protein JG761_439 [Proteiniphilum sp.]|jgi:sialate O-acetylesterase|nr:hypothetical protein [Proteiniphilum sp.]